MLTDWLKVFMNEESLSKVWKVSEYLHTFVGGCHAMAKYTHVLYEPVQLVERHVYRTFGIIVYDACTQWQRVNLMRCTVRLGIQQQVKKQ